MDYETTIITIVIALMASIATGFFAWIFRGKERKDSTEKIRTDKSASERALAKELREESEEEAIAVRQEMRDHVTQLLTNLRAEIELAKVKANNLDDKQDIKIEQLAKDFSERNKIQDNINEKTMKAIEFVQTMLWGPEAKSMPPYMLGQEETQEHKDEPEVGMFTDPKKKRSE